MVRELMRRGWSGGTHWCDTTVLRDDARLQRMKRPQQVQMVKRKMRGKLPIGCGFSECVGSVEGC